MNTKAFFAGCTLVLAVIVVLVGQHQSNVNRDIPSTYVESSIEVVSEREFIVDENISDTTGISMTTGVEDQINTDEDLFYLAAVVCSEAGGLSEETQLLVANVVMNRVESPLYPNTIEGVLTQYKQYGMMWKYGISFPDWADEKTISTCYGVAKRILSGDRVCPKNVLYQAEFKQGSGVYKKIDGIYFCYYR